ncbi:MAG: MOP flippase family protein [Bacteroidales bacterium]|nr:MOP flippase family protein [Bacteroidales bacterium]
MNLRQKTISGLKWSFIESTVTQGVHFIVGIVLARLLSPSEFGLIGMLTFFIAISQSLIDSGFSQALIRKQNCTDADYSTVFYFNLAIGVLFYFILFFSAGAISDFYKQPQLFELIRVLGLVLIINSFTILQSTILTKNINFKLQTKISLIASVTSGIIAITMACMGFGVWALVAKTISQQFINSLLLWFCNNWIPCWVFDKNSFKELFNFGSRLMVSGLIDTTYKNVYFLIIGKYFSSAELGYYTRANQFSNLFSSNITSIIQRVSYPVLTTIQDEPERLKSGYKKLIKTTMFISFVLMLAMAAIAKPMVLVLIGNQWLPAAPYLQLLCFVGMLYPLHALNLNMLNVKGRSDLFLKLEIIKKTLAVPVILIGILAGIEIMITGMFLFSLIAFFINSYWSARLMNYPVKEQLADILPAFLFALFLSSCIFFPSCFLNYKPVLILSIQCIVGCVVFFLMVNIFKIDAYQEMKQILKEQFTKKDIQN